MPYFCDSFYILFAYKSYFMDNLYKIAINMIPHVGAVTARTLISYCGDVEQVFKSKKSELVKIPGIGETLTHFIQEKKVLENAEKEERFVADNKIELLFYLDENYPQRLKNYDDSPVTLFYKGNAPLNVPKTIGVIGTRKPTPRGRDICKEIIQELKEHNPLVISGLAMGIDVTAHTEAMDCGLMTIGVMGCGFNYIYPPQHKEIAEKMIAQGGLLTEFISHYRPIPENFPMRNRIVAALSDALLVVESGRGGGSMITAQYANDYNKDVFAVPGRTNDIYSAGCNYLIKNNLASLVESAEDILKSMMWDGGKVKKAQKQLVWELTPEEQTIANALQTKEFIHIEELLIITELSNSRLAPVLLEMELKGVIKAMPGKRYTLIG